MNAPTPLAPSKPRRKNPALRTPQMNLPPAGRSRVALGLTSFAALGDALHLQVCGSCGHVQYPPQEFCGRCLGDRLRWQAVPGGGTLLSETRLTHSNDLYFKERLPWRIGTVKLDAGPTVIALLTDKLTGQGARAGITLRLDRAGQALLVGHAEGEDTMDPNDKLLKEMGCDPRQRKVLVADGKTAVGQALVRALSDAGAETIWVGHADPWKKIPGFDALSQVRGVELVPLDLTDSRSVDALGSQLGGKVDIVISNGEVHHVDGISSRRGTEHARMEMDVNYLGLLRLSQAFAPALKGRAADGADHAVAWVNLLSIFALSNFPGHGTFSASKAAAYSLAQCLRAEMLPLGIRVMNVFPGPIDDEWNQNVEPPKLAPRALAGAIVKGLVAGVEDLFPGDLAQEWLTRWRDNPKVLERELARGEM